MIWQDALRGDLGGVFPKLLVGQDEYGNTTGPGDLSRVGVEKVAGGDDW